MTRIRRARALVAPLGAALLLTGAEDCSGGDGTPSPTPGEPVEVSWWLTTGDQSALLAQQPSVWFEEQVPGTLNIDVDASVRYQTMEGFGAALTDSAAWLLTNALDDETRDGVMTALFSPTDGIGISYIRVPFGASDFALEDYTYDDQPPGETDEGLEDFSIDHDRAYIIPLLQQARALSPQLRLMATPWSPPAWMKTSGSLHGGSLEPEYRDVFARYLVAALSAYQDEDLDFSTMTVQNEPLHEAAYPSMHMTAWEQAAFIEVLGPVLADSGLFTAILAFDHNWADVEYPDAVLTDEGAAPWIAGTAFHCYDGDVSAQSWLQQRHPDKDLYFSECSGGGWSTDFGNNLSWNLSNIFIGSPRNGARSALLWNLALDEAHGPTNGGCQDCRGVVTVDQASGAVRYEVEYYVIGHLSRFVQPGAARIDSTDAGLTRDGTQPALQSVAFENPDGSLALVVLNAESDTAAGTALEFTVSWRGRYLSLRLPLQSVATLVWKQP